MKLTVMTLNLKSYCAQEKSKLAWYRRVEPICRLVEEEKPSVIATQECSMDMLEALSDRLFGYISLQNSADTYNDDNALFINYRKLNFMATGVFSLSNHPQVANSRAFFSLKPCKCSYAEVTDGKEKAMIYNTQLNFLLPYTRNHQLSVIKDRLTKVDRGESSKILLGDFNMSYNSKMTSFEQDTGLSCIVPTNIGATMSPQPSRKPIDHILVSPDWQVEEVCKIYRQSTGRNPSEHCAVLAKVKK